MIPPLCLNFDVLSKSVNGYSSFCMAAMRDDQDAIGLLPSLGMERDLRRLCE